MFALLAGVLWIATGHDKYESALFQKTTTLATLLLPPIGADVNTQAEAVQHIAQSLEFDITLWAGDGRHIASSGRTGSFPEIDIEPGTWVPSAGETRWTSRLPDGRWIVIELDKLGVPSDVMLGALALLFLAIFTAAAAYPFISQITRRIEALQDQVLQIGAGNLAARAAVDGNDEIAALARSFNEAADQIERLVAAQRMLLANASHELRTPLARIRLGIELMASNGAHETRNGIESDISELDQLIDELILMTRLDTGTQIDDFEPVDLMGVAAEECARYDRCDLTGSSTQMRGDRRLLKRLVRNLLDNAFVHGVPPVDVRVDQSASSIKLTVSDGGRGIPEGERGKVFQPFYRESGKQNVSGYGLGLALVERIAGLHGARVRIESEPRASISVVFKNADALDFETSTRAPLTTSETNGAGNHNHTTAKAEF